MRERKKKESKKTQRDKKKSLFTTVFKKNGNKTKQKESQPASQPAIHPPIHPPIHPSSQPAGGGQQPLNEQAVILRGDGGLEVLEKKSLMTAFKKKGWKQNRKRVNQPASQTMQAAATH